MQDKEEGVRFYTHAIFFLPEGENNVYAAHRREDPSRGRGNELNRQRLKVIPSYGQSQGIMSLTFLEGKECQENLLVDSYTRFVEEDWPSI